MNLFITTHHQEDWAVSPNDTSIKLQADSNILVSPEAGRDNCLPYVLAPPSLSCESGG